MEVVPRLSDLIAFFPPPAAPEPFVARSTELLALSTRAARSELAPVIVTGVGGVGKTALAAEYVRRMAAEGAVVAWLTPAALLALPNQVARLQAAVHRAAGRVVIVLDDATSVDQIAAIRTAADNVQTVVTTRDPTLAELGETLALGPFAERDAAELLKRLAPGVNADQAIWAVRRLGALPLAVALAAQVITRTGWNRFEREFGREAPVGSVERESEVSAELEVRDARMSYERGLALARRGEYAEAASRLEDASALLRRNLGPDHSDTLAAMSALGDTLRLSGRPVEAVELLRGVVNRRRALEISGPIEKLPEVALAAALRDAGLRLEATQVLARIVPELERSLGSSHPDVIQAKTNLAVVLADIGQLQEAAAIQQDALSSSTEALGPDHRLTMTGMGNLASILSGLGRMVEAIEIQEDLYAASQRVLGPDHPDALTAASNLAKTLYDVGRNEEAAALEESVLDRRLRVLGLDHPQTLAAANNLAFTLQRLGRWEQALLAAQSAVAGYRRRAEEDPRAFLPHLMVSLRNQSSLMRAMGRGDQALVVAEEVVSLSRELASTSPDAFLPDLAGALNNMSMQLQSFERLQEGLAAVSEAVAIYKDLAASHPDLFRADLAASLANMSIYLRNLERQEEALIAVSEAVVTYRELAAAHPDSFRAQLAAALTMMSFDLRNLERQEEALTAVSEAVVKYRELAATDPDSFRADLARSLLALGTVLTSVDLHEEALSVDREALQHYLLLLRLGNFETYSEHVRQAMDHLAIDLRHLGWSEADIRSEVDRLTGLDSD